jgi:hypothetical protein
VLNTLLFVDVTGAGKLVDGAAEPGVTEPPAFENNDALRGAVCHADTDGVAMDRPNMPAVDAVSEA